MELMNQPFTGQLGNLLIELLDSPDYHTLNIAVAFARTSGVSRIKDSLEKFRARGGKVNIYVGVDLGGTSYEALTVLLACSDSLNVVHSENGQTFHAKIYHFLGNEKGIVVVGSHNLTGGGLWTNFESSIILPIDGKSDDVSKILAGLNEYIGKLASLDSSFMLISIKDDLEKLLENGYIFPEKIIRARQAGSVNKKENRVVLFGNGIPAKIPEAASSIGKIPKAATITKKPDKSASKIEKYNTIWFETKKMTGGSRNILDLSKKSLVTRGDPTGTIFDVGDPRFMRGAVEFFGVDPTDLDQIKSVSIEFGGIEYRNNDILFPKGKKANGTWRLQIKGESVSDNKITTAFAEKGGKEFLMNKVVTFTRIRQDCFLLEVHPKAMLSNFKQSSRLLARNGTANNSRQFGLL